MVAKLFRNAVMALLLSGCTAGIYGADMAKTDTEKLRVQQVNEFVDGAAKAYRTGKPAIIYGDVSGMRGAAAFYRNSAIYIGPAMFQTPHWEALLAHELGHYILGHDPGRAPQVGGAAARDELYQREHEANREAVFVVMKVKGLDEDRALQQVWRWRDSARRAGIQVEGHADACTEIRVLLAGFPTQKFWAEKVPCAPAKWAERSR